jgi:hypothetical protein
MDQQKNNPKVEWGFYATTPRIVRTQYKNITLVEKWLYVCLKDLCGDTGTCYRTLRVLALETDLALGTLSTGIRHLHEAGLIHAEKKRRSTNPTAKEVWHITIVDIWQENAKVYPTAQRSADEHYTKNVQQMNNNVHTANNDASQRSADEQQCSNFDDRSKNKEVRTITEERTREEEGEHEPEGTRALASALSLDAAPASCFFCDKPMTAFCIECGKPVCSEHGTHYYGDMTWCDLCLDVVDIVDAPSSPQSENGETQPVHTHEGIEHPFTCYYDGTYYAACPLADENDSQLPITDSNTQEGDSTHAQPVPLLCPPSLPDLCQPVAPTGAVQVAGYGTAGHSDGLPMVAPVVFAAGSAPTGGRAQHATGGAGGGRDEQFPHVGDMVTVAQPADHAPVAALRVTSSESPPVTSEGRRVVVVGSLTVTPIAVGGATVPVEGSHEQNRDASRSADTVEDGSGHSPLPGVTSPRWNVVALVARAEALREKPFSESARPKETRAARKLFARKPDLTMEEFERAWQRWDTQWWHENNGLFTITDLAAVPKNKSEMRLIIALEQLALPKKPPGERVIPFAPPVIVRPASSVRSFNGIAEEYEAKAREVRA